MTMAAHVKKTLLDVFNGGSSETVVQKPVACLSSGKTRPPSPPQGSPPKVLRKTNAHKKSYSTGSSSSSSGFDLQKLLRGDSVEANSSSSGRDREDTASRSSESVKSLDIMAAIGLKEKKKRRSLSWYNVLSPSYKSRTEDFKRLFKDLPASERLIVDYSCAIQKDILVHGRIYISQNFICFYANIFRWETSLVVKCKDITSISKEKTALVIPNAIQICTSTERYFFTSFGAREKTYMMLFRVWQNALMEQPMTPREIWQWIHLSYGDDLGLTSDDDDYIRPTLIGNGDKRDEDVTTKHLESLRGHLLQLPDQNFTTEASIVNSVSQTLTANITTSNVVDETATFADEIPEEEEECGPEPDDSLKESKHTRTGSKNGISVALPTVPNRTTATGVCARSKDQSSIDVPSKNDNSEIDTGEVRCLCPTHEGREMVNVIVGYPVDIIFEMIFSDSKFRKEFHASRKTTDIVHTPWRTYRDVQTRQLSYTLKVNLGLTVKTAETIETHTLVKGSQPGHAYTVNVEAITPGLPYGDVFYTHHAYCLTRVAADECRLCIHTQLKYRKSIWGVVKSFIERNAWSGLSEFYKQLETSLLKEAAANRTQERSTKVRRRRRVAGDDDAVKTVTSGDQVEDDEEIEEDDDEDADKIFTHTPQWRRLNDAMEPFDRETARSNSTTTDVLVLVILLILISLLVLNALLYYKLWTLEVGHIEDGHTTIGLNNYYPGCSIDPELLKQPKSNEEWLKLLQQQEVLHRSEVSKWRDIIDVVVGLLQESEKSLINLKNDIEVYNQRKTYPK